MSYVHGYTPRETQRLLEQSLILEDLLHSGTTYSPGSRVLEIGCGVGAQTCILARRNPGILIRSIDKSAESVQQAREVVARQRITGVSIQQADLFESRFKKNSFDHIFICFVLEHLSDPVKALEIAKDLLEPGGSITLIEGDHGSGCWTPETAESRLAWEGLVRSQKELGHDPNIGRRLYPLLKEVDFDILDVSPRPVYADRSDPVLLEGIVNKIIYPMVYSAEKLVLGEGMAEPDQWQQGLLDIARVASVPGGTFFYSWFKGTGIKPK